MLLLSLSLLAEVAATACAEPTLAENYTTTQCADVVPERHRAFTLGKMRVTPLSPALGAEVAGLDGLPLNLTEMWDDGDTRKQISALLLSHQVIVFHGQQLLPSTQLKIAKQWGSVGPHPLGSRVKDARDDGVPDGVVVLKNTKGRAAEARNDMWHSDVSCVAQPTAVNLLYAADYEPLMGFGDTLFANMERAYEELSLERQEELRGMDSYFSTHLFENDKPREVLQVSTGTFHPTVRTHPDTCRDSLYISPVFFEHFRGMSASESKALHAELLAISTTPENTYRHRWLTGDLVIFDNRNTMHYAVFDYEEGQVRTMHSSRPQMEARPFSKHRETEDDWQAQWCRQQHRT